MRLSPHIPRQPRLQMSSLVVEWACGPQGVERGPWVWACLPAHSQRALLACEHAALDVNTRLCVNRATGALICVPHVQLFIASLLFLHLMSTSLHFRYQVRAKA